MLTPASPSCVSVNELYVVGTAITGKSAEIFRKPFKKDRTSSGFFSLLWIIIASTPAL